MRPLYKILTVLLVSFSSSCDFIYIESSGSSHSSEDVSDNNDSSFSESKSDNTSISSSLHSEESSISQESYTSSDSELSSESSEVIVNEIDSMNDEAFRLSSISDIANSNGINTYKMFAPYDDSYKLECSNTSNMTLYDKYGNILNSSKNKLNVTLNKNDIIYLELTNKANAKFDLITTATNHLVELPYEINSSVDITTLSTTGDDSVSPLKPYPVTYTKRNDSKGLYVNCNNPEVITTAEFNTVLTRQEVTGKDVFFTFEHNNASVSYYYYGYRVTNVDDKDIFVTVKNLGYHVGGTGCWLGEDEWIKFYNTKFDASKDKYSTSQKKNYDAYIGFANNYQSANRKPITYRIPSGKYIYVIGGTTADAYNNINVFNSADVGVKGGCGNGAVIFSVSGGKADGAFMVYNDSTANKINQSDYVKKNLESGYVVKRKDVNVGSQYVGYDNCHGVVDADLLWVFNDKTKSGYLPVKYSNKYYTNVRTGTPYSEITSYIKNSFTSADNWVTHINPNSTNNAIGTDMTDYITIDNATKKEIIIDVKHYDGRGEVANIGNWMVDYIDTFTLVNQGNKTRRLNYDLDHNGVILAFVRDENGYISNTYTPRYCPQIGASTYGDAIDDGFVYDIEIPAHSIVRFSVDYNLLANSCGYIKHKAWLD